jgi:hypothetical protein
VFNTSSVYSCLHQRNRTLLRDIASAHTSFSKPRTKGCDDVTRHNPCVRERNGSSNTSDKKCACIRSECVWV